jgi:hypothetical protein
MGVWEQVDSLIAEGRGVVITLTAGEEMTFPKGPPGRPRSRLPPFIAYAFWQGSNDIKNRMVGRRPRCQRRGCGRYLRKQQSWVYSDECGRIVIDDSLRMPAVLK